MITPVILTLNEEHNLRTTLAALHWADRVVVVDSGSDDRTEQIANSFGNVSWHVRKFDDHLSQWSYAIRQTQITTNFVLALDADMRPDTSFQDELQEFLQSRKFVGAYTPFQYRVEGLPLAGSLYPAQLRIFLKDEVLIQQPGHSQVFTIQGPTYRFRSKLIHDDKKPIERWLNNQLKYASLEAARIKASSTHSLKDRLRLAGFSPAIWGAYSYLRAGGPFNSRASRAYAYERMTFEAILARLLIKGASECEPSPAAEAVEHEYRRSQRIPR